MVVTDTDTAGNMANATLTFTLDTTIATPTIALAHDTGSSNSDKITNDPSIAVSAAAADVSRSFTVDNGTPAASYIAPTADGQHTVVVTDTDTADNTANATLTFTLDTTIATPTVALAHDTGSSNSDKITKDASITVSAAASDVSRSFTLDNGALSLSYVAPTADGQHTVVVTDTDIAGNTASASLTFTLDRTIATPIVALAHDTGSSSSDGITKDASITVSAAASDVSRTFTVDNGPPSLSYVAPTADGAYTVVVTDTDTAGNTGNTSLTFTLDTTAPAVTETLQNDTSDGSLVTSDDTLTGSGDPNALVTLSEGASVLGTASADSNGIWNFTPTGLADGSHTIVASETDAAGNTGTASLTFTLATNTATAPSNLTLATANGNENSAVFLARSIGILTSYVYSDVADAGNTSFLQSINAAGQALGTYRDSNNIRRGFIYDSSSGMPIDVPTPDGRNTNVQSITDAGQVLGTYFDDNNVLVPFVFDSRTNTYITINDPGFSRATIQGVNGSDQILGYSFDVNGQHAFLYDSASKTFTPINDPLPADVSSSLGQALNDAGQVLGSYRDGGNIAHAFVYDPGSLSYIEITNPAAAPGDSTYAQSINSSGQVLAYYVDVNSVVHSFIYDIRTGAVTVTESQPRRGQRHDRPELTMPASRRLLQGCQFQIARIHLRQPYRLFRYR